MATYTETVVSSPVTSDPTLVVDTDTYGPSVEAGAGATSSTGGPVLDQRSWGPSLEAAAAVTSDPTLVVDTDTYGPSVEAEQYANAGGVKIPTGAFRWVTVEVQDKQGEPLKEALWVQSRSLFPVMSRVVELPDGRMVAPRTYLLPNVAYDELAVIGREDGTWYRWFEPEVEQDEESIGRDQNEAVVRFEKKVKTGLPVTAQSSEGGNLSL